MAREMIRSPSSDQKRQCHGRENKKAMEGVPVAEGKLRVEVALRARARPNNDAIGLGGAIKGTRRKEHEEKRTSRWDARTQQKMVKTRQIGLGGCRNKGIRSVHSPWNYNMAAGRCTTARSRQHEEIKRQ